MSEVEFLRHKALAQEAWNRLLGMAGGEQSRFATLLDRWIDGLLSTGQHGPRMVALVMKYHSFRMGTRGRALDQRWS